MPLGIELGQVISIIKRRARGLHLSALRQLNSELVFPLYYIYLSQKLATVAAKIYSATSCPRKCGNLPLAAVLARLNTHRKCGPGSDHHLFVSALLLSFLRYQ